PKLHGRLDAGLRAFFKPGISIGALVEETRALAERLAPRSGPVAGARASLILHGRGLGDDHPLIVPGYEGEQRAWQQTFPENGVYICKPTVMTADRRYAFEWGDSVRTTPAGALRMGRAPPRVVISEPREGRRAPGSACD